MVQFLRLGFFVIVLLPSSLKSQLGGTKYIPGDYPSLANFIGLLNAQGVNAGGLVVNIAPGYTETAPVGGFVVGSAILNATLTSNNTLLIQRNPVGGGANPLFTAFRGTSLSSDGLFKFLGTDYISIKSIDLKEAVSNNNNTKRMEFGFALLNLNKDDGCHNFSISNCTIILNSANTFSKGIFTSPSDVNINPFIITQASGTGSDISIDACSISNCYVPISINGYSTMQDVGISIGSSAANTIFNYGGTNTNTIGINVSAVNGLTIKNNTITLPTGSTRDAYGIYTDIFCTGDLTIDNNVISVSSSATSRILAGIYNDATNLSNLIITNNLIRNTDYSSATTGSFYGIADNGSDVGSNVIINGNTISGITYANAASAGSGNVYAIYKPAGNASTVTITSNTINNNSLSGNTGGTFAGIRIESGQSQVINSNDIINNAISGSGALGTIYGILCAGNISSLNNNTIHDNQVLKASNTASIYGIFNSTSTSTEKYTGNLIYNLTSAGNTSVTGIKTIAASSARTIAFNIIYNLSSTGGTVSGLHSNNSSPLIYGNKVYTLSSSGATGTVNGFIIAGGAPILYNNIIGDFNTPSSASFNAINGILITGGSTVNSYYNTVYINASSSSSNFGSSAIYISSTVPVVTLSDNIFCNASTPGSTGGFATVFRYTSVPGASYSPASDNNLFYGGVPSAKSLIYGESANAVAINGQQTISAYKIYMAGHDRNSISENPPFSSIIGSAPDYLHINVSTPTAIESGGKPIAGFNDDFDADPRDIIMPDIGADEFNGIMPVILPVTFVSFNVLHSNNTNILTWNTDQDINCKGFYIERSFNGVDFTAIHFTNNSSNPFYEYIDTLTASVTIYYRIRAIDFDGKEAITKIISTGNYGGEEGITVYPNPVINSLHISFFTPTAILQEFQIINSEGKPVMRKENTSKQGYNLLKIDISNLIKGVYILQIISITPNINPAKKVFKLIKV